MKSQSEKEGVKSPSEKERQEEVKNIFKNMLFKDIFNTICCECSRRTKEWVDCTHGIFLCVNCALLYQEIIPTVRIKSIGMDSWSEEDLEYLIKGGNHRFKEFMSNYDLQRMTYQERLRTKAAGYYRDMLEATVLGKELGLAPDPITGRDFVYSLKGLTEMNSNQILEEIKLKTIWFGNRTKEFGIKTAHTVKETIQSHNDVKQNAIKTFQNIGVTTKQFGRKTVASVKQTFQNHNDMKEKTIKAFENIGTETKNAWEKLVFEIDKRFN